MITISVVYALPDRQQIISLQVAAGTSAAAALQQSGVLQSFPEIDADSVMLGIYSRLLDGRGNPLPEDYVMQEGDRLEIYRPLVIDPKQARLNRARKKDKAQNQSKKIIRAERQA